MSADGKLSIILEKRIDDHGGVYHIGKLKGPIQLDARDGICFLIFTSIAGEEELQIGTMIQRKEDRK